MRCLSRKRVIHAATSTPLVFFTQVRESGPISLRGEKFKAALLHPTVHHGIEQAVPLISRLDAFGRIS